MSNEACESNYEYERANTESFNFDNHNNTAKHERVQNKEYRE